MHKGEILGARSFCTHCSQSLAHFCQDGVSWNHSFHQRAHGTLGRGRCWRCHLSCVPTLPLLLQEAGEVHSVCTCNPNSSPGRLNSMLPASSLPGAPVAEVFPLLVSLGPFSCLLASAPTASLEEHMTGAPLGSGFVTLASPPPVTPREFCILHSSTLSLGTHSIPRDSTCIYSICTQP